MTAPLRLAPENGPAHFNLRNEPAYRAWRDIKLQNAATSPTQLIVDVRDATALSATERQELLLRCARFNIAIYRSATRSADPALPIALGQQLGLDRLDINWLADDAGVSPISVRTDATPAGGFIPYTNQALQWHTDGYYHPAQRRIEAVVLHCVRQSSQGGANQLLDHEMAYIALRDLNPDHIRALVAPDAMTIPARVDEEGIARPEQSGPVFDLDEHGHLRMRYTARTRNIIWKNDAATAAAVTALRGVLATSPFVLRHKLEPGEGLVCNNVLHDREAFVDDSAAPRLLLRARYLDRVRPAESAGERLCAQTIDR